MVMPGSSRIPRIRRAAAVAAVLCAAAVPPWAAAAQEPDLGTLSLAELMQIEVRPVFGASQRLQPVTEAPSSVTIVTADEIARYGYQTLADILRSVRGFYVTYDRNYSYVGVRGFGQAGDYNTRILLLVDGHRLNDVIYDQAAIGTESGLDPRTFERVEVIRGPASSLYGTSAFFAVVNVITKSGAEVSGVSAALDAGSFGTAVLRASAGRRLPSGLDVALFATTGSSDGPSRLYFPEFDAPGTSDGVAVNLDDDEFHQVLGRVGMGAFVVRGLFGTREKGVPTAAFDTVFGDPRLRTTDSRAFVDAQYERPVGETRLTARAYLDRYHYDGTYPYEADGEAGEAVIVDEDSADGIWWGAELRVSRAAGARQTLSAGGELRHNVRQDQAYGPSGQPPYFDIEDSSHVLAAYLQDEVRLHARLLVNAGVRYDRYAGFDRLAPRVGIIVPTSPNQSFKYLYGKAFRAPNAYESLYYSDNPAPLVPETVGTHEVVWERYTSTWLRTSVSAWRSDVRNLITLITTPDDDLAFVNRGRARTRGLDLEGEIRLSSGIQSVVSHTWQRADDPDAGERLANAPGHVTQVRVSALGPLGVVGAFEVQRVGRRLTVSGLEVEPATAASITARWPIARDFTVTGSARNLFDRSYGDPASQEHTQNMIWQDGRTFRVGLEWRLPL